MSACGGNDDEPVAATADLTINAANVNRVAGEALHSFILPLNEFNSLVADNVALSSALSSAAARSKLLRVASAKITVRPLAVVNSSTQCLTSGQSTITVSQAVEGKLGVGDFVEKQFDACVEGNIEFVGKAREAVTAVNAAQTLFDAKGELTSFGRTQAGITVLASGAYDLNLDRTNVELVKLSASADKAINVERRVNQRVSAAYSLEALKRTIEGNLAAGAIIFNIDYAVTGSFLQLGPVRFQVSTPQNLAIALGDGALTGAIKVIGIDGGNLLLTFLNGSDETVRLDLDANGDGTIDQSETRTVDELLQLVLAAQ